MNSEQESKAPIYLGEFRDERLEQEFYQAEIVAHFNWIRLGILAAALFFLVLLLPVYDRIVDHHDFRIAASMIVVVTVALFFLFFKVSFATVGTLLSYWFTGYEIAVGLALLYLLTNLMPVAPLVQVLSLIVMILVVFLINSRWLLAVFTTLLLGVSYFVMVVVESGLSADAWVAGLGVLLIIVISSLASYRSNTYKRFHYLNLLELIRLAEFDALTGIYNKAKFNKDYDGLTERARRQQGHLSVVMFDIDNFKEINTQHGHLVGDAILLELANFIQLHIRSSDIFVRWGGDKFILTFPDIPLPLAAEIAEKLRVLIGDHDFAQVGHLSCSFGVAAFEEGDQLDSLVRRADQRLDTAKTQGKNRVVQG